MADNENQNNNTNNEPEGQKLEVQVNDPTKYIGVPTADNVNQGLAAFAATADYQYNYLDFTKHTELGPEWIQLGVCAINFSNMEMPYCLGCTSNCKFLCCSTNSFTCKPANHNRVKAVCYEDVFECVMPNTDFKCYRQCFCLELACGWPLNTALVKFPMTMYDQPPSFTAAPADDLIPTGGMCCTIDSCYTKFPDCIGCYSKGICLIFEWEGTGCKPFFLNPNRENKDLLCLCNKQSCQIVDLFLGCKRESRSFCCDHRAAFPWDSDVPCVCMPIVCCTLFVNFKTHLGCFQTLKQIQEAGGKVPEVKINQT